MTKVKQRAKKAKKRRQSGIMEVKETHGSWQSLPEWCLWLVAYGLHAASPKQSRRITIVSLPCDSPAIGLVAVGTVLRRLHVHAAKQEGHDDEGLLHFHEGHSEFYGFLHETYDLSGNSDDTANQLDYPDHGVLLATRLRGTKALLSVLKSLEFRIHDCGIGPTPLADLLPAAGFHRENNHGDYSERLIVLGMHAAAANPPLQEADLILVDGYAAFERVISDERLAGCSHLVVHNRAEAPDKAEGWQDHLQSLRQWYSPVPLKTRVKARIPSGISLLVLEAQS